MQFCMYCMYKPLYVLYVQSRINIRKLYYYIIILFQKKKKKKKKKKNKTTCFIQSKKMCNGVKNGFR